jgi:hypothetical protein
MWIVAFCFMPNYWHPPLWRRRESEASFMPARRLVRMVPVPLR